MSRPGPPFPWDAVLGFAFGVLRLGPRDAWALTPREIAAAWRALAPPAPPPMGRAELEALIARFPDGGRDHGR